MKITLIIIVVILMSFSHFRLQSCGLSPITPPLFSSVISIEKVGFMLFIVRVETLTCMLFI